MSPFKSSDPFEAIMATVKGGWKDCEGMEHEGCCSVFRDANTVSLRHCGQVLVHKLLIYF